jgi:hypothetical protein
MAPLLLMGTLTYAQDKISGKMEQIWKLLIEIGPTTITYKELDNLEGPMHSLDKSEVYQITYNNGKTEVLGKYKTLEEAMHFITSNINEYGIDRDRNDLSLHAEFQGDNIRINSLNKRTCCS